MRLRHYLAAGGMTIALGLGGYYFAPTGTVGGKTYTPPSTFTANVYLDVTNGSDTCARSASLISYSSAAGHICKTWAEAAAAATGGDVVGVKAGTYPSTLSFGTYIGQPGSPTDLSDGTNTAVTFQCADGAASSVTTSQSGFQISAKYMTVTGRCFNFVHVLEGYSGDSNVDDDHVTFNDVNMQGYRIYGSSNVTISNSTVGPDVSCQRNGDTAFASTTWCQNNASTGEAFYYTHNLSNCSNEAEPGVQPNVGQATTNFTFTGNLVYGHNTRDSADCHVGGLIILQSGDLSSYTIRGDRWHDNAVYNIHTDAAISNLTIEDNFFGSPVNGLAVAGAGAPCNCNDVELKGNSTGVVSRYNTYSNGINWSNPGTPTSDKSVGDIINKAFSGCIAGVTYNEDVWWSANGTCGTNASTYSSTAIFTDFATADLHLTGATQTWENTIPAGCGTSDTSCDLTTDYDGTTRTVPRTPGADQR